jgi:hypothetical protein
MLHFLWPFPPDAGDTTKQPEEELLRWIPAGSPASPAGDEASPPQLIFPRLLPIDAPFFPIVNRLRRAEFMAGDTNSMRSTGRKQLLFVVILCAFY